MCMPNFAGLQSMRSRHRDPCVVVHLVEIGFTSDLFLHLALTKKRKQRAELCNTLTAYGWANVQQHEIFLGRTGVMLTQSLTALQVLGVSAAQSRVLLKGLALSGLRKSCAILVCCSTCTAI